MPPTKPQTVIINGNTYEPRRAPDGTKCSWWLVCDEIGRTYRFESESSRAGFIDAWTKVGLALTALDSVFVETRRKVVAL
jgi:hypothetical protein